MTIDGLTIRNIETQHTPDGWTLAQDGVQSSLDLARAINETEKPSPLLEPLISYGCPPGGLVLDLFAGSCFNRCRSPSDRTPRRVLRDPREPVRGGSETPRSTPLRLHRGDVRMTTLDLMEAAS